MSEKITAENIDEIIVKNDEIREEIENNVSQVKTQFNSLKVSSSSQLAFQILQKYGLIQMPIDDMYLSGAIFVKEGKLIPFINTALPRVNQYFTAWHEIYHLKFAKVEEDHIIDTDAKLEERKAEYFAAKMLLGDLLSFYMSLPTEMEFKNKIFHCMSIFQAPYKSIMLSLYEEISETNNNDIATLIKTNFDIRYDNMAEEFRNLGLDDSLVLPSYVINISDLSKRINDNVIKDDEVRYHKINADFLANILEEIKSTIEDTNA